MLTRISPATSSPAVNREAGALHAELADLNLDTRNAGASGRAAAQAAEDRTDSRVWLTGSARVPQAGPRADREHGCLPMSCCRIRLASTAAHAAPTQPLRRPPTTRTRPVDAGRRSGASVVLQARAPRADRSLRSRARAVASAGTLWRTTGPPAPCCRQPSLSFCSTSSIAMKSLLSISSVN